MKFFSILAHRKLRPFNARPGVAIATKRHSYNLTTFRRGRGRFLLYAYLFIHITISYEPAFIDRTQQQTVPASQQHTTMQTVDCNFGRYTKT